MADCCHAMAWRVQAKGHFKGELAGRPVYLSASVRDKTCTLHVDATISLL